MAHRLQGSRHELKYIMPESLSRPLRQFAACYLEPDEYADPAHNNEYEVHSLYLDSPSLALCRATMQGLKNRFKLRIRFYEDSPTSPLFFEIKRRVSDVILKERAKVRRSAAADLLAGHWPRIEDVYDRAEFGALQRFCALREQLSGRGQTFVSYRREAYVSPGSNQVRMTFDRRIEARGFRGPLALGSAGPPLEPRVGGTVLELKFTDRFPNWMRHMIQTFGLERTSMAKYVACVSRLARDPLRVNSGRVEVRT